MNLQSGPEIQNILLQKNTYEIIACTLPHTDYEKLTENYYVKDTYQFFLLHQDKTELWVSKDNSFASTGFIKKEDLSKIPLIEYSQNADYLNTFFHKQLHYSYYFSDYSPAFDLLKSNSAGMFATKRFVLEVL